MAHFPGEPLSKKEIRALVFKSVIVGMGGVAVVGAVLINRHHKKVKHENGEQYGIAVIGDVVHVESPVFGKFGEQNIIPYDEALKATDEETRNEHERALRAQQTDDTPA